MVKFVLKNIDAKTTISNSYNLAQHKSVPQEKYFTGEIKEKSKYIINMIDINKGGPLPKTTNLECWWCRHTFSGHPIGCPLEYYSHDNSIEKQRFEEKLTQHNISYEDNGCFETEGIFCSFPCCKAYILDQKNNAKYKNACSNLSYLYFIVFKKWVDIPVAPTWKILSKYGGIYNISDYRENFGNYEYVETVNIKRPYMFSSSQYINEKKIKLFKE